MSGPNYPRYATASAPGQNAIGTFAVGISPLGDVPPFDQWKTVISQYANSPILDGIINAFNAAMDPTEVLDDYYDMMMNVATAVGYGLDVWGRIVGVKRTLSIPGSVTFFGFEEAGSWTGFGQGGFFTGSGATTNFVLSDSDFRKLVYAKAAGNISDGSIPGVNQILLTLFPGRGICYVQDNQNMSLAYVFKFPLTTVELAILGQSNVLPNPAGVAVSIVHQ